MFYGFKKLRIDTSLWKDFSKVQYLNYYWFKFLASVAFGFNSLTNLAPTQSEKLCASFWYDLFSINNDFTASYYCLGFWSALHSFIPYAVFFSFKAIRNLQLLLLAILLQLQVLQLLMRESIDLSLQLNLNVRTHTLDCKLKL